MLSPQQQEVYRSRYLAMLKTAGITLRPDEAASLELADFALNNFQSEGLGLIVYINNDRYCAKELLLLPHQTCPEHRHPRAGADPGKTETFRCRWGKVFLYTTGPAHPAPACSAPSGKHACYTVWQQIELNPGDQHTIPSNTLHWFQAGPQGAVVSEFSSPSHDESDIFTDPALRRV